MPDINYYNPLSWIAIIALIAGLIILGWALWRNHRINSARSWPRTNAVIINAVAEITNGPKHAPYIDPSTIVPRQNEKTKFKPIVSYRYIVNGREYTSTGVVFHGKDDYDSLTTSMMMTNLRPGATVQIFFNPNNPSESYLFNGESSSTGIWWGAILILIGLILGYIHKRKVSVVNGTYTTTQVGYGNDGKNWVDTLYEKWYRWVGDMKGQHGVPPPRVRSYEY